MEEIIVKCKYMKDRWKTNDGRCSMCQEMPPVFCNTIFCTSVTNVRWTFFLIYKEHLIEVKDGKRKLETIKRDG